MAYSKVTTRKNFFAWPGGTSSGMHMRWPVPVWGGPTSTHWGFSVLVVDWTW